MEPTPRTLSCSVYIIVNTSRIYARVHIVTIGSETVTQKTEALKRGSVSK